MSSLHSSMKGSNNNLLVISILLSLPCKENSAWGLSNEYLADSVTTNTSYWVLKSTEGTSNNFKYSTSCWTQDIKHPARFKLPFSSAVYLHVVISSHSSLPSLNLWLFPPSATSTPLNLKETYAVEKRMPRWHCQSTIFSIYSSNEVHPYSSAVY